MITLLTCMALAAEPFTPRELVDLPDPGAATQLSTFPGFGAGHFYAQQPVRGAVFAGIGVVTMAGLAGTYQWQFDRPTLYSRNGGPEVRAAMIGALLTSKVVEVVLAPYSARRTARKRAEGK